MLSVYNNDDDNWIAIVPMPYGKFRGAGGG